jgi:hypothetical protein
MENSAVNDGEDKVKYDSTGPPARLANEGALDHFQYL